MRTREAIGAAFVALLRRRRYASIRVSDITRSARIGRATFYAHFDSKDALLSAQLARIVMPMIQALDERPCLVDATRLFEHVLGAPAIYVALTGGAGSAAGERIVQDALERRIAGVIERRCGARDREQLAPAFVPRFVAGTLLAIIAWALEQAPAPAPRDLQAMFATLVGRALAPAP